MAETASKQSNSVAIPNYPIGPGDQLTVWALGAEELSDKPVRVDSQGYVDLPLIGRIVAAGKTPDELRREIQQLLEPSVRHPKVSLNVTETHSQSVSVLGAVNHPGVYPLQGRKTLTEALSLAEGLRTEAGNVIHIKRSSEYTWMPLPNGVPDTTGTSYTADLSLKEVLDGSATSLLLAPNDVITVPNSPLVYVMGEVHKPGGYVVGTRDNISVLQAVAMSDGLTRSALDKKARLLRVNGTGGRSEITVDLNSIMAGKQPDIPMRPDDILVVPNNAVKNGWAKAGETAVNAISGVAVYRVGLLGAR